MGTIDFTKILDGNVFKDGRMRAFAPYKGWFIVDADGDVKVDPFTHEDLGPLKVIPDPLSHGNWHTLYNILGKDGKKVLGKGVRSIKHFRDGYYLIKDNNEDELINRRDVKSGFLASEYVERFNVVFDNGSILSDEWYDSVSPAVNGYFLVSLDGKENLVDFNGKCMLNQYESGLTHFFDNHAYFYREGVLFRIDPTKTIRVKQLSYFDLQGHFHIGRHSFDTTLESDRSILERLLSHCKGTSIIEDAESNRKNIITNDGYLLFNHWYEALQYTGVIGQYLVKDEGLWKLMDAAEKELSGPFDDVYLFCGKYTVSYKSDFYSIIGASQGLHGRNFDSVIWADSRLWGMNILSQGSKKHYYQGQGGDVIYYAHEVLISNKDSILLGKDGLWFYYDGVSEPTPFLRYP
ncbi:MAG: hypothetical protein IJ823_04515 [Bacteroidales bacterium]|nr:hypothetical protein [Bacteroidales bacterium]